MQLSAAVVTETDGTTAWPSLPRPTPGSSTGRQDEDRDRTSQRDAPVPCAAAPVQLPAAMGFVHAPVMSCLPGLTLPGFGGSNANPQLPGQWHTNLSQVDRPAAQARRSAAVCGPRDWTSGPVPAPTTKQRRVHTQCDEPCVQGEETSNHFRASSPNAFADRSILSRRARTIR